MICLTCDNETFTLKPDAVVKQVFRYVEMDVKSPAWVCNKCGSLALDSKLADELRKNTIAAFKKRPLPDCCNRG